MDFYPLKSDRTNRSTLVYGLCKFLRFKMNGIKVLEFTFTIIKSFMTSYIIVPHCRNPPYGKVQGNS